jgi:hypothetical protein
MPQFDESEVMDAWEGGLTPAEIYETYKIAPIILASIIKRSESKRKAIEEKERKELNNRQQQLIVQFQTTNAKLNSALTQENPMTNTVSQMPLDQLKILVEKEEKEAKERAELLQRLNAARTTVNQAATNLTKIKMAGAPGSSHQGRRPTFEHTAAIRMFVRPKVFNQGGQHTLYNMSEVAVCFKVTPTTIKHVIDLWLLENGMTHRYSKPVEKTTYRGKPVVPPSTTTETK